MSKPSQNLDLASREEFEHYLTVDLINAVEHEPRWTVSSFDKMPLDIVEVMNRAPMSLHGAAYTDERSLTTRPMMMDFFANRPFTDNEGMTERNHTFHLDVSAGDPFLIIDIEATCPPDVRQAMINKMPWVYCERSNSGKGFHLVVPTPWPNQYHDGYLKILYDAGVLDEDELDQRQHYLWETLSTRNKIRVNTGFYEILCDHYITFTHKCGEFLEIPQYNIKRYEYLESIIDYTIENAPTPSSRVSTYRDSNGVEHTINVSSDHPEHILFDECVESVVDIVRRKPYQKTPEDFDNDMSRWEFGLINYVTKMARSAIREVLRTNDEDEPFVRIDENTFVWIVFEAVTNIIPHRDKHNGFRESLPYLLSRTKAAFGAHVEHIDENILDH